ncbi:hypothetical protein Rwratislav_12358 [Rhodococcus wratislaviensis IFP 2016]|nr:hypothetical protein Rwratislav_12358 [Rhodococcus wratislaviensis IFP 2016]
MSVADQPMSTSRLARGRPVAYRGTDTGRDILGPGTRPRVLYQGHPGRITDSTVQHILVDWVGLENEPASFAVGFCPDTITGGWAGPVVPGLAELTEDEYTHRADRIRQGLRPTNDIY